LSGKPTASNRLYMIRIKIIKSHKQYKVGETVYVTPNIAHDLIDGGYGEKTKDMTSSDYIIRKKKQRG
jgi:hypothetical protein